MPEDDLTVSIPEKYLDERYFVVRARGDSMEDTIPNGAFCVFQREADVREGSIALVQIDGPTDQPEIVIKRIYKSSNKLMLMSDNPEYPPRYYSLKEVRITGILVKVLG